MTRVIDVIEGNVPLLCKLIVDDDLVKENESKIEVKFRIIQKGQDNSLLRRQSAPANDSMAKMHKELDKMNKKGGGGSDSKHSL